MVRKPTDRFKIGWKSVKLGLDDASYKMTMQKEHAHALFHFALIVFAQFVYFKMKMTRRKIMLGFRISFFTPLVSPNRCIKKFSLAGLKFAHWATPPALYATMLYATLNYLTS